MLINDIQYNDIKEEIRKNFFINYDNIPDKYLYIYKITNIKTNHSYIGKTHNIKNRISQYILCYMKKITKRFIIESMVLDGIENYKMEIIDTANSDEDGVQKELYYMHYYDTVKHGYNKGYDSAYHKTNHRDGNYGHKHNKNTKLKKSKFIAAINLDTNDVIISTGMKLLGDFLGDVGKDLISHAKNRCGKIHGYYIIALNPKDNIKQIEKVKSLVEKNSNQYKLINKCREFLYCMKIISETLKHETMDDDYTYTVITQTEEGYEEIDIDVVYEYFKLMMGKGSDNG